MKSSGKFFEALPECLMEGAALGLFMLVACATTTLLDYPGASLQVTLSSPAWKRGFAAIVMAATAICLMRSPWGQQSGAHLNPAVSMTFCLLGRMSFARATAYSVSHFVGASAGVALAGYLIGSPLAHPDVAYAATKPGPAGEWFAFVAETLIAFTMMTVVLWTGNSKRWSKWTPYYAASLVGLFIFFESPYSGMSLNPARSFGSAVFAQSWDSFWLYALAPLIGMFSAAALYTALPGAHRVYCAKLHHHNARRCLFRCEFGDLHAN